jgi:prepilin-type processing-associated H-X9-DG protein
MYATNNDERMMPATNWQSRIEYPQDYVHYRCPLGLTAWSYAYNGRLEGADMTQVEEASTTVVFFDCDAYKPSPTGGPEWMVRRHNGHAMIAFLDGHSRRSIYGSDGKELKWKPELSPPEPDLTPMTEKRPRKIAK